MDDENGEIISQIDKLGQLQLKDTDFMRSEMDKILLNKLKCKTITRRYGYISAC